MVERSSYEKHPLGRLEWIKLFGILFGKQQQADDYFNKQVKRVKPIMEKRVPGKRWHFCSFLGRDDHCAQAKRLCLCDDRTCRRYLFTRKLYG